MRINWRSQIDRKCLLYVALTVLPVLEEGVRKSQNIRDWIILPIALLYSACLSIKQYTSAPPPPNVIPMLPTPAPAASN